jgi:type VI protein secretion system component Hcp
MPESNLDAYLYFEGEGKYGLKQSKSVGSVKGETLDSRFQKHGASKIWSFAWTSKHGDAAPPDEISTTVESDDYSVLNKPPAQLKPISPNRKDSRVSVGAFTVTKDIDVATPTLFKAHAHCAVFESAHVYFRKTAGAKAMTFFRLSFSDVIIETWSCDISGDCKETITINFDWCQVTYFPQSMEGVSKKTVANVKEFCTSNPDNDRAPEFFKKTTDQ